MGNETRTSGSKEKGKRGEERKDVGCDWQDMPEEGGDPSLSVSRLGRSPEKNTTDKRARVLKKKGEKIDGDTHIKQARLDVDLDDVAARLSLGVFLLLLLLLLGLRGRRGATARPTGRQRGHLKGFLGEHGHPWLELSDLFQKVKRRKAGELCFVRLGDR